MMRNWIGLTLTFIVFIGVSRMPASAQEAEVTDNGVTKEYKTLYIGVLHDVRVPHLPEGARFDGDFRKVTRVSVNPDKQTLRFRPTQEGVATLVVKDAKDNPMYEFRLDVRKSDLTKIVREIKSLLSDIDGINIRIVNNRVVVDGKVILPKDLNRIYSVIRQYDGLADSLVELSPLAQKKIAEIIERDINNPEIHVRAVNDKFILEGVANSQAEKDRAEIIAKTYVPDVVVDAAEEEGKLKTRKVDVVINLITIKPAPEAPPGKIIQIVVHYVELRKDYERAFRFQWTPDVRDETQLQFTNDSRSPGGVVSTITGIVYNLLPKLNWAKSHGHARVLQSSSMIVQENEKGHIQSIVQVPYNVTGANGAVGTSFTDAGLIATVTPVIVNPRSDSIQLNTNFEVSSYVGSTNSGPMITRNTVQTVITVRSGQSAAIGGLITNTSSTDYNKLPKNASDNPLFSLYASKAFQRNQSQFVVFVTPIIKSSASAGSEKIKEKFRLRD